MDDKSRIDRLISEGFTLNDAIISLRLLPDYVMRFIDHVKCEYNGESGNQLIVTALSKHNRLSTKEMEYGAEFTPVKIKNLSESEKVILTKLESNDN